MLRYLQISVASLALSVFAVAPAVVVISADTAIAKNDNGKGGGNGGGKGGGNGNRGDGAKGKSGDKGKSASARSGKSHKAGKSHKSGKGFSAGSRVEKSLNRFGNKVKNGFGLFDGLKKNNRTAKASSGQPGKSAKKGFDHPSNLGKMNGAINSSPNAKLAHIRNGNFNGPVGIAAAYSVADAQYAHASEDYQMALDTIADNPEIAGALGYIEGYEDAVAEVNRLDAEGADPASQEYADAVAALEAYDFDTYQEAIVGIDAADPERVTDVENALAKDAPDRTALTAAEDNLIGLYKGPEEQLNELSEDGIRTRREALIEDTISPNLPTRDQVKAALPADDPAALHDDKSAETVEETDVPVEES